MGLLPLVQYVTRASGVLSLPPDAIGAMNLFGWSLTLAFFLAREELYAFTFRTAQGLGLDTRGKSLERMLTILIRDFTRKNSALSLNILENRITSKDELSRTLEKIVNLAFRLLDAESAELALFDRDTGLYHSSFVLGKPFRTSAQAMLSGALENREEETSPDVVVQPIAFAGSVLGSLRVALRRNSVPSTSDREIMQLLALQGGLALINAQYTEQLIKMKQSSEESVKAKTGFLANLSHEIRGPLGIMMNAVELVLDGLCGKVTTDQLETLQMVKGNGEHLLELINDVLDYAKVESGKITPQPEPLNISDLLKDLSNVVRSQAETKKHSLTFRNTGEVLVAQCDRRHFRQILINMLTNAIKYTPDGGKIELWAERSPGQRIKIFVKDSGVGIDEADRPKVFAAFQRVEHSYSINQVGTGLGMPLTKRLVEMNSGTIDFSSAPGEGSTFWVLLPSAELSLPAGPKPSVEVKEARGTGEVILLADSSHEDRAMLTRYLSHIGFRVIPVSSKREVVDALRQGVHLVMLDNSIEDYQEVFDAIRNDPLTSHLPIAVVSSKAFVFDIEQYLRAGADRCLSKPIALRDIGIICRELIDQNKADNKSIDRANKNPTSERVRSRLIRVDDLLH